MKATNLFPPIKILVFSIVFGTSRLLILVEWVNEGKMEFTEHMKYCGPRAMLQEIALGLFSAHMELTY